MSKLQLMDVDVVDALHREIEQLREALDEIAYGAPWGGPAKDHVTFLRKTAREALEKSDSKK